jgi:hypothetical protein
MRIDKSQSKRYERVTWGWVEQTQKGKDGKEDRKSIVIQQFWRINCVRGKDRLWAPESVLSTRVSKNKCDKISEQLPMGNIYRREKGGAERDPSV